MIHLRKRIWIVQGFTLLLLLPLCQVATFLPEASGQERRETKSEEASAVTEVKKGPANLPYTVIAEKNIFSPERKEFPLVTQSPPAGELKKPAPRPQIVLYGITIAGDYQSATLSNPVKPLPKGERETVTLKVGGMIGEYKVAKILVDRVVMESGEDSFEVLLYDPKNPKKRTYVRTETKPAAVASAVPSPAPPSPGTPTPTPSVPTTPAQERVTSTTPASPTTPTYPFRPGRGRTPLTSTPGTQAPSPTSEAMPLTPVTPTPIGPPTSVPVPMMPSNPVPIAPPTSIPVIPGGPIPQGSGGQ